MDLAWLSSAPNAADDVHAAYLSAADRGTDEALRVRARLHAELEFARWLLHGESLRREDIVDDASALLESLAEGVRQELSIPTGGSSDVESAMDALDRVPGTEAAPVDTGMQTDAYRPEELWSEEDATDDAPDAEKASADDAAGSADENGSVDDAEQPQADRGRGVASGAPVDPAETAPVFGDTTEDLSGITGVRGSHGRPSSQGQHDSQGQPRAAEVTTPANDADAAADEDDDDTDSDEAQRAARAALQRWTNSSSE
jgi:hypothetical protein